MAVELKCIDDVVMDSEINDLGEVQRSFAYNLKDKQVKSKLLKGAKRCPFDTVRNNGSVNLVFNLGSWQAVVLPSLRYWNLNMVNKPCQIGSTTIKIFSIKTGTDAGGKHVDTQIVFFLDREKAVCHF